MAGLGLDCWVHVEFQWQAAPDEGEWLVLAGVEHRTAVPVDYVLFQFRQVGLDGLAGETGLVHWGQGSRGALTSGVFCAAYAIV